jgi:hypothetical protein
MHDRTLIVLEGIQVVMVAVLRLDFVPAQPIVRHDQETAGERHVPYGTETCTAKRD